MNVDVAPPPEVDLTLIVDASPSEHNVDRSKEVIEDWTAVHDGTFERTLDLRFRNLGLNGNPKQSHGLDSAIFKRRRLHHTK